MRRFIRYRVTSLREKMIVLFTVLIICIHVIISSAFVAIFSKVNLQKTDCYMNDITKQTTNNIENNINILEDITFDLLKNSVVQDGLRIVNQQQLSEYDMARLTKRIENELDDLALYNDDIISLSILSLDGLEFTTQQVAERAITRMFEANEIYGAAGSTLWGITDTLEPDICVARSIIDLRTQQVIGSINLICKEEFFSDLINDISMTYSGGTYIIDESNIIVSSNGKQYLGQTFDKRKDFIIGSGRYYDKIEEKSYWFYVDEKMGNGWTLVNSVPFQEINKEIQMFRMISICISVIIIGISILVILIMTKRMTKPILQLCASMEEVGNGDLKKRVKVVTEDEIGKLGTAYNSMVDNIENLIEKVYKLEISQKQAEVEFLKMQINPHFLYNTLDTISWMARMKEHEDIADVTVALAELLRATIKQDSFISIEEELQSVKNYLFIQQYRFGNKIRAEYVIDEKIKNYRIPNFILQPLIENSIIHGLEPKIENGFIKIKIYQEEAYVRFEVADDGVGMTKDAVDQMYKDCEYGNVKHCIGLRNVYRRLNIYYGTEYMLHIESKKNIGTNISFKISMKLLSKEFV